MAFSREFIFPEREREREREREIQEERGIHEDGAFKSARRS